jgi:hypothetical protein
VLEVEHLRKTWTLVRSRGSDRTEHVVDVTVVSSGAEVRYYTANIYLI